MKKFITALAITSLALTGVACGDDGDDGGATGNGGGTSSNLLSDLTDEEVAAKCAESAAAMNAMASADPESVCFVGLLTSWAAGDLDDTEVTEEVCEAAIQLCMDNYETPPAVDCTGAAAPDASCTATVSDFETCSADTAARIAEIIAIGDSMTCADVLTIDAGDVEAPDLNMMPESCSAVTTCDTGF